MKSEVHRERVHQINCTYKNITKLHLNDIHTPFHQVYLDTPPKAHHHELLVRDLSIPVQVKVQEGGLQVVLALELALVNGRGDELLVVDGPVAIDVSILQKRGA